MKDVRAELWNGSDSPITGLELAFNSTTVLRVKAGTATVNRQWVTFAQTDYTSASTMKDIANATVTLGASAMYWVFLSHTGVIGIEKNDGTGDGVTPVYDTTLDYWKAASSGAIWRRIGSFWTNGSSQIHSFYVASLGRLRRLQLTDLVTAPTPVNGVNNASYTSVTITPYYTADMAEMNITVNGVNGVAGTPLGVYVSIDGGTGLAALVYISNNVAGSTTIQTTYQNLVFPYTGTLHYKMVSTADCQAYIFLTGFSQYV